MILGANGCGGKIPRCLVGLAIFVDHIYLDYLCSLDEVAEWPGLPLDSGCPASQTIFTDAATGCFFDARRLSSSSYIAVCGPGLITC